MANARVAVCPSLANMATTAAARGPQSTKAKAAKAKPGAESAWDP